jgi:hypothetical protein
MNKYIVNYGYRTDDGMVSSVSTHFAEIEVEAETPESARRACIDKVYGDTSRVRSHVKTLTVRERSSS